MARLKSSLGETRIVRSLDEADKVMAEMIDIRRQIKLSTLSASEEVDAIKARLKGEVDGLEQKVKELKNALELYSAYNGDELFAKKKSIRLAFGTFGYRAVPETKPLPNCTWGRVLEELKQQGLTQYIQVKITESVDKIGLRDLAPEKLQSVCARVVRTENFFCELDEEQLAAQTAETGIAETPAA